ncbi:hypothetical protein CANCADRAFT_139343 [Tortispora caseinolytica NRRL Y-17796]|uniref:Nucleolar complex-associated protein 3 n=1 Tax=Tortispora caseinolytica NRRL Y-17796 TaxID=767744 RepID=A0A1E4TCB3_9ASCO|nr:hypothetical protein CANCADRAFT_139343 [Tortispora caseinolytica NRRL Y-17796]
MTKKRKQNTAKSSEKKQKTDDNSLNTSFSRSKALQDQNIEEWNVEQDYEKVPRVNPDFKPKNKHERLPVIHNGVVTQVEDEDVPESADESDGSQEIDNSDDTKETSSSQPTVPSDRDLTLPRKLRVQMAKKKLSQMASEVLTDPESNYSFLKVFREYMDYDDPTIVALAIATQSVVYKDIIPAYRIRPLTEAEKTAKVSKEVTRTRNYEQSIAHNFTAYTDAILHMVKAHSKTPFPLNVYEACTRAINMLLTSCAHFNSRENLLKAAVIVLGRQPGSSAHANCVEAIKQVFSTDQDGSASLDVVRLIEKMLRRRQFKGYNEILDLFLYLRLLNEFTARASATTIDTESEETKPKLKKKDRVHLSKNERKKRKEAKKVEEEFAKAESQVSADVRFRNQGETLKLVFSIYFNILKDPQNKLIGSALEGLARFAHLVESSLFSDLLVVIRELTETRMAEYRSEDADEQATETPNIIRQILLCIVTAQSLLEGQKWESNNLDLSYFINTLHAITYDVALDADLELSSKTLHLEDPLESTTHRHRIGYNKKIEADLYFRALELMIFTRRTQSRHRIAAIVKRLAVASINMPEKSSARAARLINRILNKHSGLEHMLSTDDQITNGIYRLDVDDMDKCLSDNVLLYEKFLLKDHYSRDVQKASEFRITGR